MVPERETKSVSVEGTYDTDLTDRRLMEGLVSRQAVNVAERLRKSGLSGRTITLKVRLHDFTTLSRSTTLNAPTDAGPVIARLARSLLGELDLTGGVRLLGVGVSGLADWIQDDLFGDDPTPPRTTTPVAELPDLPDAAHLGARPRRRPRGARPGLGLGRRARHRHRPVRDRGDPAGAGPLPRGGRPRTHRVATTHDRGPLTSVRRAADVLG